MIFVCACCSDKFSNDRYLEYQKHIEKKEKICIYCGIMTASVCALLNHMRTNHKKNEVSKCYKCLREDIDSKLSSCIHLKQYLRSLKAINLLPEIKNIKEEFASENKTEGENEAVCKGCKKSFQNILRHLACTVWKSGINCKLFYTNELLQELKQKSQERLKRKKKERAPRYHKSQKLAIARYKMSERGKEKQKQRQAKYFESVKGKEILKQCQARYRMSKKGREKQKENDAKYSMSVKGKERQKRRSAKWRTSREANNCVNKSDSEENKENNNISQLEVPLADIASNSDTEVMFLGSIDRDFSCKVTNCLSDFWFKSQLEEHIAKVHK